MNRPLLGLAAVLLAGIVVADPSPARRRSPRPASPPLDFSGVWRLDPSLSVNVPSQMKKAILSVTQKGNHIWISPVTSAGGSMVMAEEIVADGRSYEKALGSAGKGIVTASWAEDRQSLRIEVKAGGEGESAPSAMQRSLWKLSADRKVWVRETVTVSQGAPRTARLVFRRNAAEPTPTSTPRHPVGGKKAH